MAATDNLKKAVLYAKSQCGLKPFFQDLQDEEIIYYLDHLADTEGENEAPQEEGNPPAQKESKTDGQQVFDI